MTKNDDGKIVGKARPETTKFFKDHLGGLRGIEKRLDEKRTEIRQHVDKHGMDFALKHYIELMDETMLVHVDFAEEYHKVGQDNIARFSAMLGAQFGVAPAGWLYHFEPDTELVTLVRIKGGTDAKKKE